MSFMPGQFPAGAASSGAGILPTDIPNCQLWLRADMGVTKDASNVVSLWTDQSGNNHSFNTDAEQVFVESGIGGQNIIRFDGTNDRLLNEAGDSFVVAAPFHFFVVFEFNAGNANLDCLVTWENDTASDTPCRLIFATGPLARMDGGSQVGPSVSVTQDVPLLAGCFYNGSSSYISKNDGANVLTANNLGTNSTDGGSIGCRTTDRFCTCDIAEIILYSGEITGTNLALLRDYINRRYNLW